MTPSLTRLLRKSRVSPLDAGQTGLCGDAFEPIVATDPLDPAVLAVAFERYAAAPDGDCVLDPAIAISRDAGATWRLAPSSPWIGSARYPDHHVVIAWGLGPTPGSTRLYWADMTTPSHSSSHLLSVASSADEGRHWSPLYTERRTPPWVGGYPDITVDNGPASPNRGAVYVAYNWSGDGSGPGLRIIASADFGRTWVALEIPPASGPPGFGAVSRIGYRLRTGPDGTLYVASYQASIRAWDPTDVFSLGGPANVGRLGFVVASARFDRPTGAFATTGPARWAYLLPANAYTVSDLAAPGTAGTLTMDPRWQVGFDVDPGTGAVYLAVPDYRPPTSRTLPRGTIRVGRSENGGRTWRWTTVPPAAPFDGLPQSSFRPSLVADDGVVFVGFHVITDVGEADAGADLATIGTAWAVSIDGGTTFGRPLVVPASRWDPAVLASDPTGTGLRERAERAGEGRVVFVYGDGRLAMSPDHERGASAVFAALFEVPHGASG